MPLYTIAFNSYGTTPSTTFGADYYKQDDGWITFKDAQHKVIAAVPESVVQMITADPVGELSEFQFHIRRIIRNEINAELDKRNQATVNHFTINNPAAPEPSA